MAKLKKYDKDATYKVGDRLEFENYGSGEVIETGVTGDPEKLEKILVKFDDDKIEPKKFVMNLKKTLMKLN